MNISFMQDGDGNIRVRVHLKSADASDGGFDWQVKIIQAEWDAILGDVGTGGLAAIAAGTADLVSYSPDGKSAGSIAPNDQTA